MTKRTEKGLEERSRQKLSRIEIKDRELVKYGFFSNPVAKDTLVQATQRMHTGIILTGVSDKPESYMTALEKMKMVRNRITKRNLVILKRRTRLDYNKLAHALSVTRATLINKKSKEKFNSSLSERIISLADIYSYGFEVFEEEDRFNRWMFQQNPALGGRVPYDLMDNQFGREEIRNIIGRIDFGVYS